MVSHMAEVTYALSLVSIVPWGGALARVPEEAMAHARLVKIKDRYDPTNLFRLNHNIRPSGAGGPLPGQRHVSSPTLTLPASS